MNIKADDNFEEKPSLIDKIKHKIIGNPRDIQDPKIFHKVSLIALLAWIGLGADGLSSSSYGPEEAFKALGQHTYLLVFLALATALTVFIISYAYSRIIEHFPSGGGGYVVATHTLGEKAGVISGSALLVDYILTITVSIVACTDALFSFLPPNFLHYKIITAFILIIILIILNLRGVKESIIILAPIFLTFILTHLFMIGYGILSHVSDIGPIASGIKNNISYDLSTIGFLGILSMFVRSYSLGAGTYTGIEAVSNGLQVMREPKVETGKRTMTYMAISLAFTAGGLCLCYLLLKVNVVHGRTLNTVLADALFGHWVIGRPLVLITILSEGALLFVAAQTGFIDGPRVMANMAIDSWLPHRFSALSERLTLKNGILLMGISAILLLFYTKGSISTLVVMYSINVFLTFSLSETGMVKYFITNRKKEKEWKKHISVHITGLVLCLTILIIAIYEKFYFGGWMTLLITLTFIGICYFIRAHYIKVKNRIRKLDELLMNIPTTGPVNNEPIDPKKPTAIILVAGYNGFGVHTLLSVASSFPNVFNNFIFVSVSVMDSGSFKGIAEVENLKGTITNACLRYVDLARRLGFAADCRMDVGTEVVDPVSDLCASTAKEFSNSTVFMGNLIFEKETLMNKVLHNELAYHIQRRLQWLGITTVIMPIRVKI
ncbi:MAG: amino acid transporter [Elusimicrobia bacterium RIFOXYD2_FULL_34_15]|nr:MAG: amino acid transporter [Elusimicrobia bacterium RIFOXYD2_FULL_34_15]